jgi:hypothetical protein
MNTGDTTEYSIKINQLQEQQAALLQELITSDPEQVLLKQLHTADIELRELAALQGYSLSLRLNAIKLLHKDSINTLQRIVEYHPDSKEAQAAQSRLKQLQSPPHKMKKFIGRFRK